MFEILDRIYEQSCKKFKTIEQKKLQKPEAFKSFVQQQIEEILNKDALVSDYLYRDLRYYLAGIQYFSRFFPKERIYIRTEDGNSPLAYGRKSKETEEIWKRPLIQKYRHKYNLLNQVIQQTDKCKYLRITFTDRSWEADSICIPSYIADKLHDTLMDIQDECLRLNNELKVEEKLKKRIKNDEELQLFLNTSQLKLEKSLYGELPAGSSSPKFSVVDMLKLFILSFRFHIHKRKYLNQEIDCLYFPVGYDTKTTLIGTVVLSFARILEKEEIYFCIRIWRNILLPLAFYEQQLAEKKKIETSHDEN